MGMGILHTVSRPDTSGDEKQKVSCLKGTPGWDSVRDTRREETRRSILTQRNFLTRVFWRDIGRKHCTIGDRVSRRSVLLKCQEDRWQTKVKDTHQVSLLSSTWRSRKHRNFYTPQRGVGREVEEFGNRTLDERSNKVVEQTTGYR